MHDDRHRSRTRRTTVNRGVPRRRVPIGIYAAITGRFLIVGLLKYTLAAFLLAGGIAHAEPAIEGSWVIDEELSDDTKKAFSGKLRKRGFPTPRPPVRKGGEKGRYDETQNAYWDTVREGKDRSSLKNLRRLGAVYPLVKAGRFDISRLDDGYEILYDGELPRSIKPNPAGRVFSASGEELVADTLGHTLAYWESGTLILETDPPNGGKVIEKITVKSNPRQLLYQIKLEMRILKEPVEIKRVFEPATETHSAVQ